MDYISNLINEQLVELTSQLFSTEDINNNGINYENDYNYSMNDNNNKNLIYLIDYNNNYNKYNDTT